MRRAVLPLALAAALAASAVAATLIHETNPSGPRGGLIAGNVESAALYCTGLGSGDFAGRVVFLNTSDVTRTLTVRVDSNSGTSTTSTVVLGAHAATSVRPQLAGSWFGIGAQVNGGGVVADEVVGSGAAQTPCTAGGVTSWYASGLDTVVGSQAVISLYNPTATAAVVNLTAQTSSGFSAPAPYQGVAIGPHTEMALNLGVRLPTSHDLGVRVNVLRGSVVATAAVSSGPVVSLDAGTSTPVTSAWLPLVTTAARSVAEIRLANPSSTEASITASVSLGAFSIPAQTTTVPGFGTTVLAITPNPAIPARGEASVHLTSSVPVVATLATGTSAGVALSTPTPPSSTYLIGDFSGAGYDAVALTNTTGSPLGITVTRLAGTNATAQSTTASLNPKSTTLLRGVASFASSLRGATIVVTAERPDLVVGAILPSTPRGVAVVSPLYGG